MSVKVNYTNDYTELVVLADDYKENGAEYLLMIRCMFNIHAVIVSS